MTEHLVFLDRSTLQATLRRPSFDHAYTEHATTSIDQTVVRLRGATIALTNKVPLRAEALAQLPALKLIAVAATGYDIVDVAACRERGIAVCNIRNYAVHTVPEHVFALLLSLRRNLFAYRVDVERGRWQQEQVRDKGAGREEPEEVHPGEQADQRRREPDRSGPGALATYLGTLLAQGQRRAA